MKIPVLMASWGLFLALMSKQVSAQVCSSQSDCPTDRYCNSNTNTCMIFGGCVTVSDCSDEDNGPYRMKQCMGTTICNEGTCDIDCGVFPDNDRGELGLKCLSDADCPRSLDGKEHFCASDGYCESVGDSDRKITSCTSHEDCSGGYCNSDGSCYKIGGCSTVDDCFLAENQGYPIAACVGERTCTDNVCGMDCIGSDALWPCATSDDCPGDDDYCNAYKFCSQSGTCASDKDCFNRENSFFEIDCVGTKTCEKGRCSKVCDISEPIPSLPAPVDSVPSTGTKISCTKDDDCNDGLTTAAARAIMPEMYCAEGTCLPQGSCATDNDCINPSNVFFSDKRCMGFLFCDGNGQCDRECSDKCSNGSPMARCFENPCNVEDWSSVEGAVSCVLDTCDNTCDTMLFDASGSVITEEGTVTVDRDGTGTINRDGTDLMTSGTDKDSTNTCLSSADCTEPDSYCNTSGYCASNGSCTTNEDCLSTENTFMEIECIGLKFCSDEGVCSKNCLSTVGNPCETSGDCLEGEFCARNGQCLASGNCETVEDCVNADNGLFFPTCIGTIYCQENFCGKSCGGSSETVMDGFVPTSVDGNALKSSASRATPILAAMVALLGTAMM